MRAGRLLLGILLLGGAAGAGGGVLRTPAGQFEKLERFVADDANARVFAELEAAWRRCQESYGERARFEGWDRIGEEVRRLGSQRNHVTVLIRNNRAEAGRRPEEAADLAEQANEAVGAFADRAGRSLGLMRDILARAPAPESEAAREALAELRRIVGVREAGTPPGESALERGVLAAAKTADVAVRGRIVLSPVDDAIDGWGLAATEVQVKLVAQRPGTGGSLEDVPYPVEAESRVRFDRRRCRTDPAEGKIAGGDFGASVQLWSEEGGGEATLSALVQDLAISNEVKVRVRFPAISLLLMLGGLLLGAFLRPRLKDALSKKKELRSAGTFLVDVLAGVAVLVLLVAGVAPVISEALPALSVRAGGWMKIAMGLIAALVGIPGLSAQLKKWIGGKAPPA